MDVFKYEFFLTDMLEKVYPCKRPRELEANFNMPVFKGEIPSVQLVYTRKKEEIRYQNDFPLTITIIGSPVSPILRSVELVPADLPAYEDADDGYTTTAPGLFPDLLKPLNDNKIYPIPEQYRAVWIDFPGTEYAEEGKYQVIIKINEDKKLDDSGDNTAYYRELTFTITIKPVSLKPAGLIHTEWFHADCLASYYKVKPLSEEHWKILEEFIKPMYSLYGINAILTPVFTPPLDTAIGAQRPTVQLVDIKITGDAYTFSYNQLERWCNICKKYGIQYIEIAHFFTQWGAKATPKIVALENGSEKQIFGWDTPANDPRYRLFLEQFIPHLRKQLKSFGYDENHVLFHVSDEPSLSCLEDYKTAKNIISDLVCGSPVIDALSNIDFYREGIVTTPIVASDHIMPFIKENIRDIWVYNCCGQSRVVPNRFFALPSERNRILGVLIYLFNIKGYLQWGYNFYYSRYSKELIDPYFDSCASRSFPAGDSFLVYPGADGKPLSSIRGEVFRQAIEDIRILKLIEEKYGRQASLDLIHDIFSDDLTFENYPCKAECFYKFREKAASFF